MSTPTASEKLLQERFGLQEFRRGQKEIIDSTLAGKDVLAVLPTGGGKSLCYQYPAVHFNKLVIVISPLIALMKDQVDALQKRGIPSGCLHSGQSEDEKRQVFQRMREGGSFLLYLSPERAQKEGFQRWVQTQDIALFAIDEAHCVSQWGHDFRAEYSQLNILKTLCPQVPILALTASATPFVLRDISKQLHLKSPDHHVHGFYRPNLYYQVNTCQDDFDKSRYLHRALQQFPDGRVIIYCGTRQVTEDVANALTGEFLGVDYYHAGLSTKERNLRQQNYAEGVTRILVATNAFGMGIDHPNVRLVIHYQMPANIDSLYQEMGRAGRDGAESTCVLLYSKKDKGLQSFFIQRSGAPPTIQSSRWRALDNLVSYAEGGECRHAEILTYYKDSQRIESCGHCDVCATQSERRVKVEKIPLWAPDPSRLSAAPVKKSSKKKINHEVLSTDEMRIFELLKMWRKDKSKELDVPAFVILSDKTLRHLSKEPPKDLHHFKNIYGFGEVKIERFGSELLAGPLKEA